ncbi:MAG: hypothetical protein NZ561_06420 [Phycisphaerae bacterium]|nr:hypothetical protein [Phycisphaerae bacterium]
MHVEDLKRWHWIAISLIVGVVLSSIYASAAVEGGPGERRSIGPGEFLRKLNLTTRDKNNQPVPLIRNIRVYPPVEGKQVVTLEELVITVDPATNARSGEYQPRQFVAEIPFRLAMRRNTPDSWTIRNELDQRKVSYQYVAWASKPMVYALGVGGSVLVIGILWPTLLNYLQARGYGHAPRSREETVDLRKVRPSREPPARPAVAHGPSAADLTQLAAVTAQYEKKVADMLASEAVPETKPTTGPVQPAARKWDAVAPEEPKIVEPPKEEHEYSGEYYPVDRGVKRKRE